MNCRGTGQIATAVARRGDALRRILITGASSGLGAALAEAYSAKGIDVVLMGRSEERLGRIGERCRAKGAEVQTISLDIRDTDRFLAEIRRLDAEAAIDTFFLNAGIGGVSSPDFASETTERVKEVSEVNFLAPVLGAALAGELMAARTSGRIVLIGSIAQQFPLPMAPSYSATKAGLAMYSEALRLRLAKYNVKITLVSPGFIDTPMNHGMDAPKPFLISAERAAAIIRKRVEEGVERIVVPWQFSFLAVLAGLAPRSLVAAVLKRV